MSACYSNILIKSFFQWVKGEGEEEGVEPVSESHRDLLYNRMLVLVSECEQAFTKSSIVNSVQAKDIESYEHVMRDMRTEIE